MKLTRMIAVLGAIGVVLASSVTTWFLTTLGVDVRGVDLALGQGALAAGALAGVLALVALVLRRRALSAGVLAASLAGGVALLASWLALDLHATIASGFWLTAAALGVVGAAAVVDLGGVYAGRGPLLRVSILWNGAVVRSRLMSEARDLDVGPDARSGLVLPDGAIAARLTLFRAHAGTYDLCLPPGLAGAVMLGGVRTSAAQAWEAAAPGAGDVRRLRLLDDDWGKLDFGDVSLLFQVLRAGKRQSLGRLALDTWVLAGTSLAAAVVLGSVAVLTSTFDPTYAPYALPAQSTKLVSIDPSLLTREESKPEEDVGKSDDTTAKRAEGDEGKFGDPDEPPEKVSKVPKMDGKLVSRIDPKRVGLVDLLASRSLRSGALASITSDNTADIQSKLAVAMNGAGDTLLVGNGSNGMGFRNTGTGGGGLDGFGRVHALGKIDGGGDGLRHLANPGRKPPTGVTRLRINIGDATGFCKKDDISRTVRRRSRDFRACYEERLQVNASLAGKLTVRWTIGVDGRATQAAVTGSTLADGSVGECVLRAIRRMTFQKPDDGVCVVQWPFVFSGGL